MNRKFERDMRRLREKVSVMHLQDQWEKIDAIIDGDGFSNFAYCNIKSLKEYHMNLPLRNRSDV